MREMSEEEDKTEMEFLDISLTKDLESFAPCYSQSLLRVQAEFTENHKLFWF